MMLQGCGDLISFCFAMGNTPAPLSEIPRPGDAALHWSHPQASATGAALCCQALAGIAASEVLPNLKSLAVFSPAPGSYWLC
jgi:hypothetical protein